MTTTMKAKTYFVEKMKLARLAFTKTTEVDLLLEEATCNDAWGPDSRTMARIAEASRHYDEFGPIMAFIWKRLEEALSLTLRGKLTVWRPTQKALVLLEYLLMHGSERAIKDVELRVYVIEDLCGLQFVDKHGVDLGQGIRSRATHICSLIRNEEAYRSARERAQERLGRNLQGFGSSTTNIFYAETAECFLERTRYSESETWQLKDDAESLMTPEESELVPQVGDSPVKGAAQVKAFFNRGRENAGGFGGHDRALLETRGDMDVAARQNEERKRGPSNAGGGNAEPFPGALPFDGGRATADPGVDNWLYKGTDIRALRPLLSEAGATLPGSGEFQSPEGGSARKTDVAGGTRFFASFEPSRSGVARVGRGPQEGNCKSASVLESESRAGGAIESSVEDLITWDDEKGKTASISHNSADTARDCAQRKNEGPRPTFFFQPETFTDPPLSAPPRANSGQRAFERKSIDESRYWAGPSTDLIDRLLGG